MTKILLLLALVFVSFSIISCSNDDDKAPITSAYQGNWSGTYSGTDDNGIWEAKVAKDGSLSGTISSTEFSDITLSLSGTVDSKGVLNATYGNMFFTGTFTGTLANKVGSGLWTNDTQGIDGTWQGLKQ